MLEEGIRVQRLLEYNVLAWHRYHCPVSSFVVFLKKNSRMAPSPLIRRLPDGNEILRFHYNVILLWDIPPDVLIGTGIAGLLPLVPMAQDGARREVIDDVIKRLTLPDGGTRPELLALTYLFASLAFEASQDQDWLRRRFMMLSDILRETPTYQDILAEGREEGREEESQKSLALQRHMLMRFVQARFPDLQALAEKQLAQITNVEILPELTLKVGLAQELQEARDALLNWQQLSQEKIGEDD